MIIAKNYGSVAWNSLPPLNTIIAGGWFQHTFGGEKRNTDRPPIGFCNELLIGS